jgi:hypothetical protein
MRVYLIVKLFYLFVGEFFVQLVLKISFVLNLFKPRGVEYSFRCALLKF